MLQHLAWIAGVGLLWGIDLLTKFEERSKLGAGLDDFQLIAEQTTSAISVLLMIYFASYWQTVALRFKWLSLGFVCTHAVGAVLFGVGHYVLIDRFRSIIYPVFDRIYVNTAFFSNLGEEILKDFKIYVACVLIISIYRYSKLKRAALTEGETTEKIMVMTGKGKALIDLQDITYLQAAKNYVVFMVNGREYLVRDTLENSLRRLSEHEFIRIHRSYAVQLNAIHELFQKTPHTKHIRLKNGTELPVSSGYLNALEDRLTSLALQ